MADRAQVDRVESGEAREGVVGHHAAAVEVVLRAPGQVLERAEKAELPRGRFHDAHALGHDFAADAVSRDGGDTMLLHGQTSSRSYPIGIAPRGAEGAAKVS
jgi:hypothetical protein